MQHGTLNDAVNAIETKVGITGSAASVSSVISAINQQIPQSASVATSQTTTSTTYADLGTVGPSVTVTTGTIAIVTITASMSSSASADGAAAAFAISGASTVNAADAMSLSVNLLPVNGAVQHSATYYVTGLTAGANTFKMQYRAITAGTATFLNRQIIVESVPTFTL